MAQGPLKYAKTCNICYVTGYKFHTNKHATRKAADNSGVCVKATDDSQDGDYREYMETMTHLKDYRADNSCRQYAKTSTVGLKRL